jgi:hypothetical protein
MESSGLATPSRAVDETALAKLNVAEVIAAGMSDPEFKRETRYFTGKMKICVGDRETVVEFDDGALRDTVADVPDEQCKIVVRGTAQHWTELLQPLPRPFYQCLQTTAVKHGLELSATNETFAYLPALNRLTVLLRHAFREFSA